MLQATKLSTVYTPSDRNELKLLIQRADFIMREQLTVATPLPTLEALSV